MQPRISVVIPLYNKAAHIQRTLESVFAQHAQPVEIIVVDDGSTDGGGDIVDGNQSHSALVLIRQENRGVSAARNAGVERAQGDYVAFLDADDLWEPDHLEELGRLITDFPEAGLYSTMHSILMQGMYYAPPSHYGSGFSGRVDDFCRAYADGLSLVNSSTACVRREALLAIGGFPAGVRHGEDVITWIELARGSGAVHSARVTAIYNRDADNRTAILPDARVPTSLHFLADLIRRPDVDERFRSGAALLFSRIAFYTSASRRETGAWKGLMNIMQLVKSLGMWRLLLKIALLVLAPPGLLHFARRLRHNRIQVMGCPGNE